MGIIVIHQIEITEDERWTILNALNAYLEEQWMNNIREIDNVKREEIEEETRRAKKLFKKLYDL